MTLPFRTISDQTRARWDKVLSSARRDLTERMRRLLRITLDACDSIGPKLMQSTTWDAGQSLWLLCPQVELAGLLECSDRTLRTEFERLAVLMVLQTVPHKSIPNLVAYRINLLALEALEESLTPELDEIICEFMELQAVEAEISVRSSGSVCGVTADSGPISVGVSATISGPLSGQISGQISGGTSGGSSALMNHDHDRLNEFNNSSITHDHESQVSEPENDVRRFDAISQRDVLAIAGYEIEVEGVPRKASLASRRRVQLEYFSDAVKAGQAETGEMLAFAALFRCAARLSRKPEDDRFRVGDCGAWIRKVWSNRAEKQCSRLIADDRAYARDLLSEGISRCP